jgi:xanthine dehydrogenase accessory factor
MDEQRLLVVGEGAVADALGSMGALLGWQVAAEPTLDGATAAMRSADAVVVTSHDDDVDAPALGAALATDASYIGAMGSRARQERRREWLLANGVSPDDLARVRGPAGLDIGANSAAEIALSIFAELVAVVRGVDASGPLSDRSGRIHPRLSPEETFSPEG